jgi:hypothetical protein
MNLHCNLCNVYLLQRISHSPARDQEAFVSSVGLTPISGATNVSTPPKCANLALSKTWNVDMAIGGLVQIDAGSVVGKVSTIDFGKVYVPVL